MGPSPEEDFYHDHPWVDRFIAHVGPIEDECFTQRGQEGEYLGPISNKLCPLPTSLYLLNPEYAKGLSICFMKDGRLLELAGRTIARRQLFKYPIRRKLACSSVSCVCVTTLSCVYNSLRKLCFVIRL